MKKQAAFFDRDGTLIVDHDYLADIQQVCLLDSAVSIAKMCQDRGFMLFVVTNQSGVARGFFDESFVQTTNKHLQDLLLRRNVRIEKTYYCPHHPTIGDNQYRKSCDCRKPLPGMLQQAAREYNVDLSQSLMFGNAPCDILAGQAAGCRSFDITKLFDLSIYEIEKRLFSDVLEQLS